MVTLCDLSVHVHKGIQVSQIPICSQSPINNNDYYPHKARFPLKRNAHNWSVRKLAEENANLRVLPSTTVKKVLGVGSILVVACTYCQPRTTCFSKTSPTRAANLNLRWREGERRSDKETASDGKRKIEQRETKRTRERKNEGRGEWKTKFGRRQRREGERESALRGSRSVLYDSLSKLGRRSETHSRVCFWTCINDNAGTRTCLRYGDLNKTHVLRR